MLTTVRYPSCCADLTKERWPACKAPIVGMKAIFLFGFSLCMSLSSVASVNTFMLDRKEGANNDFS
jgi:hypothetical protein